MHKHMSNMYIYIHKNLYIIYTYMYIYMYIYRHVHRHLHVHIENAAGYFLDDQSVMATREILVQV